MFDTPFPNICYYYTIWLRPAFRLNGRGIIELMDTKHEGLATSAQGESQWDILRPENNGIGEFQVPAETEPIITETDTIVDNIATDMVEANPDYESTVRLVCNVLDEDWLPDLDDSRQDMSVEARLRELEERRSYLDDYEAYLRNPNPEDEAYYASAAERTAKCREIYLQRLELQRQNPDDAAMEVNVKAAHDALFDARTHEYLIENPEARRREINYERTALKQVIAARDERYGAAFSEVDKSWVTERIEGFLDQIPEKSYRKLAEMIDADNTINKQFTENAAKILRKALGLKNDDFITQFYNDSESDAYGYCSGGANGRSTIRINEAHVKTATDYANTFAHELYHAKQHNTADIHPDSDAGKFYHYCYEFYIQPEFNYNQYRSQFYEQEAFAFGNTFERRLMLKQEEINSEPARTNIFKRLFRRH